MENVLRDLGFIESLPVEGRSSIADLFKPDNRCGIYLLSFSNNEYYCGQAVDVTRRFVQHTKNHPDITKISFIPIPQGNLNDVEVHCIHTLEAAGFRLRNISLTSMPYGESDFDLVMDPEDQDRWLNDFSYFGSEGSRMQDDKQRFKYRRKFERFMGIPGIVEVISVMKKYSHYCLPSIQKTEASFWSCSCLPPTRDRDIQILSRINIYWQEVFTVFRVISDGSIQFTFHLAMSPIAHEKQIYSKIRNYLIPEHEYYQHQYKSGGQDQIALDVYSTNGALKILNEAIILKATRLFNLRLMKKGPNANGRSHCLDLADLLIQSE